MTQREKELDDCRTQAIEGMKSLLSTIDRTHESYTNGLQLLCGFLSTDNRIFSDSDPEKQMKIRSLMKRIDDLKDQYEEINKEIRTLVCGGNRK
jgi:hypothetical protein